MQVKLAFKVSLWHDVRVETGAANDLHASLPLSGMPKGMAQ